MKTDNQADPIPLIPNQLVEIECEMLNLTGIPDEAFLELEEAISPAIAVGTVGDNSTSSNPSLPLARNSV